MGFIQDSRASLGAEFGSAKQTKYESVTGTDRDTVKHQSRLQHGTDGKMSDAISIHDIRGKDPFL